MPEMAMQQSINLLNSNQIVRYSGYFQLNHQTLCYTLCGFYSPNAQEWYQKLTFVSLMCKVLCFPERSYHILWQLIDTHKFIFSHKGLNLTASPRSYAIPGERGASQERLTHPTLWVVPRYLLPPSLEQMDIFWLQAQVGEVASWRPGATPGIRTVRMDWPGVLWPRAGKGTWEWSEIQRHKPGLRFSDIDPFYKGF